MITRLFHISAHIFLGGAEVVHCPGADQIKCALYLLIAALMIREMWIDRIERYQVASVVALTANEVPAVEEEQVD